jgi:hypothetical protein
MALMMMNGSAMSQEFITMAMIHFLIIFMLLGSIK